MPRCPPAWSATSSPGSSESGAPDAPTAPTLLGDRLADWNVTIVGSDINRAFLAEAEVGAYSTWTLRGVPEEQIPGFFTKSGPYWALREKYKKNVRFVYHNLINDEMPSIHDNIFAFDIVFCRNVMIYFDKVVNSLLVERINQVLVDDGWLFVGSTDFNPHLDATFAVEKQSGAIVYRKRRQPARAARQASTAGLAVVGPPRPGDDPVRVARNMTTARRRRPMVDNARKRRAEQVQSTGPQQSPLDIKAIVELANRGDWETAARHCRAILAADSFNAPAHYYYALILQSMGAAAEAEQALRRAIYLDRGFALAHYQLGLARKDAHDPVGSGKAFRNTLDILSQTPDDRPISPCGQVTALHLRELASQQLELLNGQ
jgi:chemotaxis protein methyltransferase CheR